MAELDQLPVEVLERIVRIDLDGSDDVRHRHARRTDLRTLSRHFKDAETFATRGHAIIADLAALTSIYLNLSKYAQRLSSVRHLYIAKFSKFFVQIAGESRQTIDLVIAVIDACTGLLSLELETQWSLDPLASSASVFVSLLNRPTLRSFRAPGSLVGSSRAFQLFEALPKLSYLQLQDLEICR